MNTIINHTKRRRENEKVPAALIYGLSPAGFSPTEPAGAGKDIMGISNNNATRKFVKCFRNFF